MKKALTTLFFIQACWWLLISCHKEKSDNGTPIIIPPQVIKELVDSNLEWSYHPNEEILSATVRVLEDPSIPYSIDAIKAVYQFSNGLYVELPRGNPGNSDKIYYEIEMKSLILHKKIRLNWHTGVDLATGIAAALFNSYTISSLNLPKKAKVVFV